ncbi:hypothetical protein EV1_026166 [Malus domestica]
MNSPSTQFVTSRRMGVFEPIHQISMWDESFRSCGNFNASASMILDEDAKLDNQSEDASHGILGPSSKYDQEATKPTDKVQRRLAQNREAARKSRMRKKAYVQQLETSRLKLIQLEQELDRVRQQQGMPHVAPSNPYGLDQVPWHKDHRWDRNRNFPQFLEFSSCFASLPRDEWAVLCAYAQ